MNVSFVTELQNYVFRLTLLRRFPSSWVWFVEFSQRCHERVSLYCPTYRSGFYILEQWGQWHSGRLHLYGMKVLLDWIIWCARNLVNKGYYVSFNKYVTVCNKYVNGNVQVVTSVKLLMMHSWTIQLQCEIWGTHGSVNEDSNLLDYDTVLIGKWLPVCWRSLLPPSLW